MRTADSCWPRHILNYIDYLGGEGVAFGDPLSSDKVEGDLKYPKRDVNTSNTLSLNMAELTVGYVAGFIALGIFIGEFADVKEQPLRHLEQTR
jgi:hypothetical protein